MLANAEDALRADDSAHIQTNVANQQGSEMVIRWV